MHVTAVAGERPQHLRLYRPCRWQTLMQREETAVLLTCVDTGSDRSGPQWNPVCTKRSRTTLAGKPLVSLTASTSSSLKSFVFS